MKSSAPIKYFNNRYYPIVVALFMGWIGVFPQISLAEVNNGKVNAKEVVVAVKRDPFWPVGHTPRQVEGPTTKMQSGSIDWDNAMKQVVINGVSSRAGNEYVAVINNEVKILGESVSISYGGSRYTWKVDGITPPGSVKLRRHSVE
jgi:hypothetical protein